MSRSPDPARRAAPPLLPSARVPAPRPAASAHGDDDEAAAAAKLPAAAVGCVAQDHRREDAERLAGDGGGGPPPVRVLGRMPSAWTRFRFSRFSRSARDASCRHSPSRASSRVAANSRRRSSSPPHPPRPRPARRPQPRVVVAVVVALRAATMILAALNPIHRDATRMNASSVSSAAPATDDDDAVLASLLDVLSRVLDAQPASTPPAHAPPCLVDQLTLVGPGSPRSLDRRRDGQAGSALRRACCEILRFGARPQLEKIQ